MRASALPLLALATLAACGDSLVDHAVAGVEQGPGSLACGDPSLVSCQWGKVDFCAQESVQFCGAACEDCRYVVAPANGTAACLGEGTGAGTCGYACTGGLLKCTQGGANACCAAQAVAAGGAHTCAITAGGALSCWGEDAQGQVTGTPSAGPITAVTTPARRFDSGVVAVAAGVAHTCAALAGEVRCWGRSAEGQSTPPAGLSGVTALAAGLTHTCALVGATGAVRCWGTGDAVGGGAPVAAGATAIAAGDDHTCALLTGGEVRCWGANGSGQLGDGSTTASAVPVTPIASGMAAIAAGGKHSCAATQTPNSSNGGNVSDALRCWGDEPGAEFLLATPAQTTPAIPMKDASQSVVRFTLGALAAGGAHFCVQQSAAQGISCFGAAARNTLGQLGGTPPGATDLVAVPGTPGAAPFAAGRDHTCAVFANGGVWCWGSNASGQLGDGTTVTPGVAPDTRLVGTPVPVSGR